MRVMEEEEDRRSSIARFIMTGELPNDGVEAGKIKSRSYQFQMMQGELYKRSHFGRLLFYVAKKMSTKSSTRCMKERSVDTTWEDSL
ncbi:hypothetical protein LIER_15068 [Lithospermum erythrorhizon]|uniref:Uncharacterized protein n=1 Tax=Lithospermum erythrorhizon TaxID=34254 RepID=A0AAV3Q4M7_LITER